MAITIKNIFLFIFCFACLAVKSNEINNDDFNLSLFGDWVKVTDDVLRKYEAEVLILSDGKEKTIYQYGFQLKDASNLTSGPFILIKVQRLINAKNIDNKMINEISKTIDKVMNIGNATYDATHNQYWSYYDDKYNPVEMGRILMVQKLAIYGKVSIFFHAKKIEFKENEALFKKISYSLSFNKKDDLQLLTKKLTDMKIKHDDTSFILKILTHVFLVIGISIVAYIFKIRFAAKNQTRNEITTKLPAVDLKNSKDNTQEVIFEKTTEDIVEYDRRGILIADDNENLINSDLQNILLLANFHIGKIGGEFFILALIFGVGISAALCTGYFEELMALNLIKLHVWSVYLIIPFITISLSNAMKKPLQKRAYLKYKTDILIIAKKLGISKYKLITIIDDNIKLNYISLYLKKDIESKKI